MSLRVYKFRSVDEMELHLRGGVVGGKKIMPGLYGLVGLTLIFAQPDAETCTFVAGARSDGFLTFAEIKSQIEGAIDDLTVTQKDSFLVLIPETSAGVEITGGTARPLFGFSLASPIKTVVYAASGAAPSYVDSYFAEGSLVLVVDEA